MKLYKHLSILFSLLIVGVVFGSSLFYMATHAQGPNRDTSYGRADTESSSNSPVIPEMGADEGITNQKKMADFSWNQHIRVNDVVISGTTYNTLLLTDTVTIVHQIRITATGTITFTLTETWDDMLHLTGYTMTTVPSNTITLTPNTPAINLNDGTYGLVTDTNVLTTSVANGVSTWEYVITKTFTVKDIAQATAQVTETLWIKQATSQPDPVVLTFQKTPAMSYVYLPLVLNTYTPPTPPTISNLNVTLLPFDDDCLRSGFMHGYQVRFEADPNGDAWDVDSQAVFHPSEEMFDLFGSVSCSVGDYC